MSFVIGLCGGCHNINYDLDTEVLCCESKMIFMGNGKVSYESVNVVVFLVNVMMAWSQLMK